jgi:hypothetical protein
MFPKNKVTDDSISLEGGFRNGNNLSSNGESVDMGSNGENNEEGNQRLYVDPSIFGMK